MEWVLIYTIILYGGNVQFYGNDREFFLTSGETQFSQEIYCEEGLNIMKARLEADNRKVEGVCLYRGKE